MKQNTEFALPSETTELLILGDGNIFVHNLTPEMAALLSQLNPHDELMRQRADTNSEIKSAS
jgi:hypothetical protein